MKHYLFTLALLFVTIFANSQNDKLPENLYGEWYQKDGNREYNGILIQPDYIEYLYQACKYGKIQKNDSVYKIEALMENGDTALFSVQFLSNDTIKVVRPGGNIAIYGKVDCPPNGTRINPEDLPKHLKKVWFTTNGENSIEFDLTKNNLLFKGSEYTIDDVILFNDWWGVQYRIIAKNSNNNKTIMFYFKNWNDGYVQIGFYGRNGDFYKNNPQYPNVSCADPQDFIKAFNGSWYSTNGKNRVEFSYHNGEISLKGDKYKIERLEKSGDSYRLFLSSGKLLKPYMIRKETDDYILLGQYKSKPELLKRTKTDKNYPTYKLPESLTGKWYSTDDKNAEVVSISSDEVILWGKKIKNPVFGKTPNGIGILTKSEKFVALITVITPTHIEVKTKKGKIAILKRLPKTENTMFITVNDLPESMKGNWFGTDGSEYWAFGIADSFFVADNAFWNYLDIAYSNNTYTLNVKNDNEVNSYIFKPIDNITCEVSANGGDVKTYTKDISKAVYKPQNSFGSRSTKDVFIQGYFNNVSNDTPSTINFLVNNIVFDTQVTYPAKVNKQGRFSVTIPKIYAQDIYLKTKVLNSLFVSPGDSLLICINSGNSSIDFMGDDADACYDILNFSMNRNMEVWEDQRKHITNDTCFAYREFATKKYEKEKQETESYFSSNTLSDNFINWRKNELKHSYPNSLMRYRWLHPMYNKIRRSKSNIPDSYFSFIKEYPINLKTNIISSTFQDYCHELTMYHQQKMYRDTTLKTSVNAVEMIKYLKTNDIKIPKTIDGAINRFIKGELDNIKDKSKIDEINNFIRDHSNLLQKFYKERMLKVTKEYYKKNNIPNVYQLKLCNELYSLIENSDTTELKKSIPGYLAEIHYPDFKTLLNQEYEAQLKSAHNPFVIENAILTKDNPSSGDSLLVNIINKHKGKVIYVDFWATWCGPCRGEMPYSLKIQEKMKGKDVVFVYLCSSSSPETKWKQLINQLKITGDHYYVNKNAWADLTGRFGIAGIPHYVLIDKEGRIVKTAAKRPSEGDALVHDIEELLDNN